MHGEPADVLTIEKNSALVAADEAADHVKAGGFPSSVWTKQANDFTTADSDIDIINNRGSAKLLDQALGGEGAHEFVSRRDSPGTYWLPNRLPLFGKIHASLFPSAPGPLKAGTVPREPTP